jgi:hypothetical protein
MLVAVVCRVLHAVLPHQSPFLKTRPSVLEMKGRLLYTIDGIKSTFKERILLYGEHLMF